MRVCIHIYWENLVEKMEEENKREVKKIQWSDQKILVSMKLFNVLQTLNLSNYEVWNSERKVILVYGILEYAKQSSIFYSICSPS